MDQDAGESAPIHALIEQLHTLGFFRFVQPKRIEGLKMRLLKKPNFWIWASAVKRDFPADEERLAEGGVGKFMRELSPVFKKAGVALPKLEEKCGAAGYSIKLNHTWYEFYSAEMLRAANEGSSVAVWESTTRGSFALINHLFQEAGSDERIYSLGGWNDHWAFILTEKLHTALRASPVWNKALDSLVLYENHDPTL